jgi:hypothetical protein
VSPLVLWFGLGLRLMARSRCDVTDRDRCKMKAQVKLGSWLR